MNWTASRNPDIANEVPAQPSVLDSRTLIEEIACAIAEAQAALFAGRIQDLEVGSSRVDLQACKLEYSIVSPK